MSMFSEADAKANAKKLEGIILKAMNDPHWDDVRSAVRGFVKEELVEWYYYECGETWGSYKPNPEILKAFPPKESESDKPSLIGHKGIEKQNDGFVSNAIPLKKR